MALQRLEDQHLSSIDISQKATRLFFIPKLFPGNPIRLFHALNVSEQTLYHSYFAAIEDELGAFDPNHHVITTVDDLLGVLDLVRKNFTQPKNRITESVLAFANSRDRASEGLEKKAEASVEFAVKWWLLADFQTYAHRVGDAASRPWPATRTLSAHIKATIGADDPAHLDNRPNRRFSRRLTLFDIDWLCLMKIKWTNNIAQHLYLEEWKDRNFSRTVYVFSHTTMMESIVQDPRLDNYSDGIKEFLNETMDTLDLLMNLQDLEVRKWYRDLRKKDNAQREKLQLPTDSLDAFAGFPWRANSLFSSNVSELRRVGHYKHWQHRLLELEKAFEESHPMTYRGWWRDRRNKGSWATDVTDLLTLVLTVLAVILTVASTLTGLMSVNLAQRANHLADDSRALAEEANNLAQEDLTRDSDSTDPTKTSEAQTVVVVVQGGYCDCAKSQIGDSTGAGIEEWLGKILSTEQVAGATTCATSFGNE